jgi:preprotein translocase subunit SecD
MSQIAGGKCMISGDFSEEESSSIALLIRHGELPLNFETRE